MSQAILLEEPPLLQRPKPIRRTATTSRILSLDGLRGLAVLGVMFCHNPYYNLHGSLIGAIVAAASSLGWMGVDLFFVLSGFLITGILLNTRGCRNYFSSFWGRRALRILPLSFSFLLVALLVFPHTVRPDWLPARADYWLYPTYLMNWLPLWHEPWHANILGHFWSLCLEEQFYLAWPLLVLMLNPRALTRVLLTLELLLILVRGWWVLHYGANDLVAITRADGLLAGSLCACLLYRQQMTRRATSLLPYIAAISLGAFVAVYAVVGEARWRAFVQIAGYSILAVAFSALLVYAVQTDKKSGWLPTILQFKPLTSLGKIAYGVYIFHVPVFYFVDANLSPDLKTGGLRFLLKYGLSIGLAFLSYRYFERYFLSLKNRFQPSAVPRRVDHRFLWSAQAAKQPAAV